MDLIDLFIGSEGVLGIVTSVDVALLRHEDKVSIIQFMDSDEQAVTLADALRSEVRLQLDFLEFYSGNALSLLRRLQREEPSTVGMPPIPENANAALFFEMSFDPHQGNQDFSILEAVINACGGSLERSWAGYESRELDRFKVFRHMVPETINSIIAERKKQYPGIHKLGTDMAVPDGHMREMWDLYRSRCEALQLEWCAFGHIGNNHIHVNILPRNLEELEKGMQLYEIFAKRAVELGGSVSAEHGIGKIKAKFLKVMFTPEQIDQMRNVKKALDPQGLLNPNDIFPAEVAA
jgi:D-lactate dehydrogenase (cytochrome)